MKKEGREKCQCRNIASQAWTRLSNQCKYYEHIIREYRALVAAWLDERTSHIGCFAMLKNLQSKEKWWKKRETKKPLEINSANIEALARRNWKRVKFKFFLHMNLCSLCMVIRIKWNNLYTNGYDDVNALPFNQCISSITSRNILLRSMIIWIKCTRVNNDFVEYIKIRENFINSSQQTINMSVCCGYHPHDLHSLWSVLVHLCFTIRLSSIWKMKWSDKSPHFVHTIHYMHANFIDECGSSQTKSAPLVRLYVIIK